MADTITIGPRFAIGTRFKPIGKKYECTVIDILRTYNSDDQLVAIRYVAEHTFAGQTVKDRNVLETTIARGLIT